jgi:UDP-3-O-[3-hydroxymyristoyl] glucosamine N-acyltransferase
MKLRDLAVALGCEIHRREGGGGDGDGGLEITGVAGMEQAAEDQLTFLANPKYAPKVKLTRAGATDLSQPLPRFRTRAGIVL